MNNSIIRFGAALALTGSIVLPLTALAQQYVVSGNGYGGMPYSYQNSYNSSYNPYSYQQMNWCGSYYTYGQCTSYGYQNYSPYTYGNTYGNGYGNGYSSSYSSASAYASASAYSSYSQPSMYSYSYPNNSYNYGTYNDYPSYPYAPYAYSNNNSYPNYGYSNNNYYQQYPYAYSNSYANQNGASGYASTGGSSGEQYCYSGYGCYPFPVDDPHQWIQDSWTGEWY